MIGNLGSRRVATIATGSLLLAASVFVVRATGINSELRASLAGQSAMASRTAVHDRLVGSRDPGRHSSVYRQSLASGAQRTSRSPPPVDCRSRTLSGSA